MERTSFLVAGAFWLMVNLTVRFFLCACDMRADLGIYIIKESLVHAPLRKAQKEIEISAQFRSFSKIIQCSVPLLGQTSPPNQISLLLDYFFDQLSQHHWAKFPDTRYIRTHSSKDQLYQI